MKTIDWKSRIASREATNTRRNLRRRMSQRHAEEEERREFWASAGGNGLKPLGRGASMMVNQIGDNLKER